MGSRLDHILNFRGKQRLEKKFVNTLEVYPSTVISPLWRLNVIHICFTVTSSPVDTGAGAGRAGAAPRSHSGAQADGGCAVIPTGQLRAPPAGVKRRRDSGPSLDMVLVTPARGRLPSWPHLSAGEAHSLATCRQERGLSVTNSKPSSLSVSKNGCVS